MAHPFLATEHVAARSDGTRPIRLEPGSGPRAPMSRRRRWVIGVVCSLVGTGALVLGLLEGRQARTAPPETATTWVADLSQGRSDRAFTRTCAAGLEMYPDPTGEELQTAFERFLGGRLAEARVEDTVFPHEAQERAFYVTFDGLLVSGSSVAFAVKVIKEGDDWVVCGFRWSSELP
jgi:hypothetical protein